MSKGYRGPFMGDTGGWFYTVHFGHLSGLRAKPELAHFPIKRVSSVRYARTTFKFVLDPDRSFGFTIEPQARAQLLVQLLSESGGAVQDENKS